MQKSTHYCNTALQICCNLSFVVVVVTVVVAEFACEIKPSYNTYFNTSFKLPVSGPRLFLSQAVFATITVHVNIARLL